MEAVDRATSYVHEALPARVVFGVGSLAQVPEELTGLGCRRVLVIAGGSAAATGAALARDLGARAAGHVDRVAQHVPTAVAAAAVETAKAADADGLCCVGGGSATGLAKAVAVDLGLPILAVPTTYAGSEATPIYGITGETKRTGRDLRALPRTIVYDPALTTGLPPAATAASGFNALAQAIAALGAPDYDPVAGLHAGAAVRAIADALPTAVEHPDDLDARAALLHAAYLAGTALAAAATGLHHKLCHAIGGRSRLVHADIHAVLLPHTVAADEGLSDAARARVAGGLGVDDPAAGLERLARRVGIPEHLAAIGLPAAALDTVAADAAEALPDWHPRAGDRAWLRDFLERVHGDAHPTAEP